MKIVATRKTATVAGAFTALGLTLFGVWENNHPMSREVSRLAYPAILIVIWAIPALLFAVGFDLKRWDPDYQYQPGAQAELREIGIRTVFWFVSSMVCNLLLAFVI